IPVRVTSIRSIDWSFRPNFFVLLSPAALADAPVVWVAALPPMSEQVRSSVQAAAARAFPNVTLFDVERLGARVTELIADLLVVVRAIAGGSLAAGLLVLVGLALSTARSRWADAALLRVLGARRRDLRLALLVEQGLIGAAAALLGLLGAVLLSLSVLVWQFDLPLVLPWRALLVLAVVITAATATTGWLAGRGAYRAEPLPVLRED
ncbi:MAG: FtsX-like permease family protein, partial [Planctomycetota bacterium]